SGGEPQIYPSPIILALARTFSVSLFNCPQAARISRPRGVRTGLAYPALKTMSEKRSITSQSEHSYVVPGHGLNGMRLIFAGMRFNSRTSSRASAGESFTPFSITYSKVMRRAFEAPG